MASLQPQHKKRLFTTIPARTTKNSFLIKINNYFSNYTNLKGLNNNLAQQLRKTYRVFNYIRV